MSNKNKRVKNNTPSTTSNSKSSECTKVITNTEKEEILSIYRNMDESKLWKLSTGKTVETQMMILAKESKYEHPCHLFIMDPEDDNRAKFFIIKNNSPLLIHCFKYDSSI